MYEIIHYRLTDCAKLFLNGIGLDFEKVIVECTFFYLINRNK